MELVNKLLNEDISLIDRNGLMFTDFKELTKDDIIPFIDEVINNMDRLHVSILHSVTMQFGNDLYTLLGIKGAEVHEHQQEELKTKLAIINDKVEELLN